jgi:Ner family transcriptional regulator
MSMSTNDKQNKTLDAILADPVLRAEWVKYQLRLKGLNLTKIAKAAGCNRQAVSNVWKRSYPAMEKRIAAALGLTPEFLFPERYPKTGRAGKGKSAKRGKAK